MKEEFQIPYTKALLLAILVFLTFPLARTQDIDTLFNLSLEELMNIQVSITSKNPEKTSEAASILTVITRQDIEDNHCRDLVDVLNMVPGMNIAKDDDYTTFTSRGLYGFEGRTLIMIDGLQLSDLYFGSFVMGNELPVHLVERIEIIRGPGSVMYGGTAELAVINIVTHANKQKDGLTVVARSGWLPSTYGHYDLGFSAARKVGGTELTLLGFAGKARRSDAMAAYIGDNATFLHNEASAGLSTANLTGSAKIKNNTELKFVFSQYKNKQVRRFSVDTLTDDVSATDRIYGSIEEGTAARKVVYTYSTIGAELKHVFQAGSKFQLVPVFSYHYSFPYKRDVVREEVVTQRIKPILYGIYQSNGTEIIAGGEYFGDYSKIIRPDPANPVDFLRKSISDEGKDQILISNGAVFAQAKQMLPLDPYKLFLVAGLRYDINELYGSRFNPKAGVTLTGKAINAKLLYSSAFRAPLVGNNAFSRYGINPDTTLHSRISSGVSAETTQILEAELGLKLFEKLMLQVNAYHQWVNNIIEFRYNYNNRDLYSDNGGKISTGGIEFEARYQGRKYRGLLNFSHVAPFFFSHENPYAYSYQDPKGGDTYITPDNQSGYPTRHELLSVPGIKLYTNHTLQFTPKIAVSANALYLSDKYAYNGNGTSKKIDAQVIFGAGLVYNNLLPGLKLQLSVHDLLNERLKVATAWYDGGYDVLPYKGREISVLVGYSF